MDKEKEDGVVDNCPLNSLPDELITMILVNTRVTDVMRFASTCKRFNEMVRTDQTLWKVLYKDILSPELAEIVEKKCGCDYYEELQRYYKLKKQIVAELLSMSEKYYRRQSPIGLEDVRNFFAHAVAHSMNYSNTISILQAIVSQGYRYLERRICKRPFTMTDMHYAKVGLRHLMHTFLCLKWVKQHIRSELTPEIVVNFFVQWTDTDNLYPEEDVEKELEIVIDKVRMLLDLNNPMKHLSLEDRHAKGLVKDRQILEAISQVLYRQIRMVVTNTANVNTLSIETVLRSKCGNAIAVGAIYTAVARKLGVNCTLISFPNHFFLEWQDTSSAEEAYYTVDLKTGALAPKIRCPFAQPGRPRNYQYYPDSLLQYIYSMFHMTMGAIKNWHTNNALHLLDFLGTDMNDHNPYKNFLPFILDKSQLIESDDPLTLDYIESQLLEIITSLSNLNNTNNNVCRAVVVKPHEPNVRFTVGMVCYHKKFDYVCVIRSWDSVCAADWQSRVDTGSLERGARQPFYHVLAADQSDRYVAQENLTEIREPTRLFHLEDMMSREFSHFDGFSYIPNSEKLLEYPGSSAVSNRYKQLNSRLRPE